MEPSEHLPTVDKIIGNAFARYAFVVYKYRWLFLLVPCCFACVFALGFYFRPYRMRQNSVETFTPSDGPSHYEKAVINGHWPLVQDAFIPGKFFAAKHWIQVVVMARDGGNVLRMEILNATEQINEIIMDKLTVWSEFKNRTVNYRDLCLTWGTECYDNGHIALFKEVEELENYIKITYPVARTVDTPLYLGSIISGVETLDDIGTFKHATHIRLSYNLKQWPVEIDEDSYKWKFMLQHFIVDEFKSPLIKVGMWHAESINQGLAENVEIIVPDFGISYLVLSLFCTMTNMMVTYDNGKLKVDWVRSKPLVAFLGVCSSGIAVVISMGFLLIVGMEYVLINAVMPILAISVGVSDMFIMVSAWWETNPMDKTDARLARMLSEAGVAITITSLTDVVSFLVGAWSSFPAVISFCIYTALAMVMDYVCQITFFAAVMAFFGDFEAQGRHCYFIWHKVKTGTEKLNGAKGYRRTELIKESYSPALSASERMPTSNDKNGKPLKSDEIVVSNEAVAQESLTSVFFHKYYGGLLFNPYVKAIVCLLYAVYAGVAIWGCLVIKEGLRPAELVHSDHYVVKFYRMSAPFRNRGMQAHVVVNNPQNLTLSENRDRLFDLVRQLEDKDYTLGSNGTIFFLKEYLNYLNNLGALISNVNSLWTVDLKDWIRYTGGRPLWDTDIIWGDPRRGEDRYLIKAFRFQIGLKKFDSSGEQVAVAKHLRSVAAKYPELNITTYHEFWPHVDQYMSVAPTTWRNLSVSFVSMIIIAFIMIPNLYCGLFITMSMLSINVGVYGYMSLWGVNLDCISMITLIMSIGFAVDLSAHISYGYICAQGTTAQRASHSLQVLGFPVLLSALATLFGVCILSAAEVPLIVTFFKTVFLVMVLGLLHSHIFLPIALTLFLPNPSRVASSMNMLHKVIISVRRSLFECMRPHSGPQRTP
uniref:SSD domain-containing protein n=1 Tax=Trichuris muris TaxID=70415 RepID=A0A5S6QRE5_TRIMR